MPVTNLPTDESVVTLADYTLFSRKREDGSMFFYTVPAGFAFILQDGLPEKYAADKFGTFVSMAARSGPRFRMRIGYAEDPDMVAAAAE